MKKRIMAVFMIILFTVNSFPLSILTAIAEEINLIEVSLDDDFTEKIKVINKQYDGTVTAEVDFSDVEINNKNPEDKVYFAASAEFANKNASEGPIKVTINNIRLEGADKSKYKIINNINSIEKYAYITPKIITVTPEANSIFNGQNIPEIEYSIDQTNIIAEDSVKFTVKVDLQNGLAGIGKYNYTCDSDNKNYIASIADNIKFEIKEYDPEITAIPDNESNIYYTNKAVLHSPEGFLISSDGISFSDSINVDLYATHNNVPNEITYYLKNIDASSPAINAVSKEMKYEYYCSCDIPEIIRSQIKPLSSEDNLNPFSFGWVSSGSVAVEITAKGTEIDQRTSISLNNNGFEEEKEAEGTLGEDGIWYYSAEFIINLTDKEADDCYLTAHSLNESGLENEKQLILTDEYSNTAQYNQNRIIFDKIKPSVDENMSIYYNNNERYVEVKGEIYDADSGINKIEYQWNDDKEDGYTIYEFDIKGNENPVRNVNFNINTAYGNFNDDYVDLYSLYLKITDNAGNISIVTIKNSENGRDTEPPIINDIYFRKSVGSQDDTDLSEFMNITENGNFAKEEIELVVDAEDVSETKYKSGIESVKLYDGYSCKNYEQYEMNGQYIFELPLNTKIENMVIKLTDKNGMESCINVNDKMGLDSNLLIIENDAPNVDFIVKNTLNNEVKVSDSNDLQLNSDGNIWYNENDSEISCEKYNGNFIISVNDFYSGICKVVISESGKNLVDNIFDNLEEIKTEYNFSVKSSELDNGEHHYIIEVTDNAGNEKIYEQFIYVDKEKPNGNISIEGPDGKEINGELWFDKNDIITVRVNADQDLSGLDEVIIYINNKEFIFKGDQIIKDKNGYYVKVNTNDLIYNDEHKYQISGSLIDVAQNTFNLKPLTVYIDCYQPSIDRFTVEKKNNVIEKVLNVLPFGVFSNVTLIFKAYVSDPEFDSGIDFVTVEYDGLNKPIIMHNEGNGIYSIEIPAGTEVFQSDIIVTAYDRYGKTSPNCPNLENTEQGKGVSNNVFAMIETNKPYVNISKPKGDGIKRTDGQVWYNTNKTIAAYVQDEDSGIRNVNINVNGIDITEDKNNFIIPKISDTMSAGNRDNSKYVYTFDTDYLTSIAGESEDGKYTIYIEVTDNAGNVNSQAHTYYIDKSNPVIEKFEFVPHASDSISQTNEYIEYLEYGFYFKKDFIANIYISDVLPSSGLNKIEYRLVSYENGKIKNEDIGYKIISDGVAALEIPAGFKGQIFVRAYDKVGNYSDEETPKAFVSDNVPPEINIVGMDKTSRRDAMSHMLYTSDVTFTVTVSDEKSGIKEIGYSQSSEKNSFDRVSVIIGDNRYSVGDDIGEGWIVSKVDENLVTEVTKTFTFSSDDNDIILSFDSIDNSGNVNAGVQCDMFTIDKTAPIINAEISSGINNTNYYNSEKKAFITITVIERNFDENLIKTVIENTYNGRIPNLYFESLSLTEHKAVIAFSEGDYTFDIRGTDLGGNSAEINMDYEKIRRFFVDETPPAIEENFSEFINEDTGNYLNTKRTAVIKIIEHNFDPNLMGLKITRKEAGSIHNENGFEDVTYSMVSMADWISEDDKHTLSITFDVDAVYMIEIFPSDPSGNRSEFRISEIFEIDTTIPVVAFKNGNSVTKDNDIEFLDVYTYERKDESTPTVEFTDLNFDHIKYIITEYTPEYINGKELADVRPVNVYMDEDKNKSGTIGKSLFTLPDFNKDGVYSVELTAVDKAGNESVLNSNTYMRIVNNDVLAYIPNSNLTAKTGWYSFQYENGDPISMKPDNFSDIEIIVIAKSNSNTDIVLRDYNGEEKNTNLQAETEDQLYGISVNRYTLKSDYFKDNFQNDTDIELYLSVKNEGRRIDLGKMHIDNIAPSCELPDEFESWHWYFGEDQRTISVLNINELLDETKCKVYDNGMEIDFNYSSQDKSLTFTLEKGWHNVGIKLEDVAGNINNIQEISNVYVGYFWLWIIGLSSCVIIGASVFIFYLVRKKRNN